MDSIALLRSQLEQANQWLEATLGDPARPELHVTPPGDANSAAVSYTHAVISQDLIVAGMLRGAAPLCATSWSNSTGVSEPMPMPGPEWVRYRDWTRSVNVDLPAVQRYAEAVYAEADAYLASLTAADLDREIDLTAVGFGMQTVAWVIGLLVIGHTHNLAGEISAAKGVQGLRGYAEG